MKTKCINCGNKYTLTTVSSHEGFCSSTCKNLYKMFDIERIRNLPKEKKWWQI